MTVPMRNKPNCDFSYAGLKNAFRVAVQKARELEGLDVESTNAPASQMETAPTPVALSDAAAADLCATFQDVAFSHVEDRLRRALVYCEDNEGVRATALVVVGGVAANGELRRRLLGLLAARTESDPLAAPMRLVFPPPGLCTDNGVMVAWTGVEKLVLGISDEVEGQEVVARWPLGAPVDDGNPVFKKRAKPSSSAAPSPAPSPSPAHGTDVTPAEP